MPGQSFTATNMLDKLSKCIAEEAADALSTRTRPPDPIKGWWQDPGAMRRALPGAVLRGTEEGTYFRVPSTGTVKVVGGVPKIKVLPWADGPPSFKSKEWIAENTNGAMLGVLPGKRDGAAEPSPGVEVTIGDVTFRACMLHAP
jgi:hypothetical protein